MLQRLFSLILISFFIIIYFIINILSSLKQTIKERQVKIITMIDYEIVNKIIIDAGEIIQNTSAKNNIYTKGVADFVTKTDIEVQEFIMKELQYKFPNIGFLGEEKHINIKTGTSQWILDPIDGTTNYIYNYRHSAISLALRNNDEIIYGIVYNPFTKEMFTAFKGKGAYLDNQPIKVNDTTKMANALIAVGTSPYYKNMSKALFVKIQEIFSKSLDIRRTGSAALDLAYVACGRHDAYFEYKLKPWDYAAGYLLVKEAGGLVGNITGENISFENISDIIAGCSSELLEQLGDILVSVK